MTNISIRLVFVVNVDWFFISHRLDVAKEAINRGYDVILISRDTGMATEIRENGIEFINVPFERAGINLLKEYKVYKKLKIIYSQLAPDILHHVTLKPIILGSLAARYNRKVKIVNAVSGLGILFSTNRHKLKQTILIWVLKFIYRGKNIITIFQNSDDRNMFLSTGITDIKNSKLIKGSGINLSKFYFCPIDPKRKKLKVLIAARMLYPKGFDEFSKAAQIISKSNPSVQFEMAGKLDLVNPLGIPEERIRKWEIERNVKWLGHINDMRSLIASSDIIVFPSYYGEGVPKFLIESCAIGRPIITTDSTGCKECVFDFVNGFVIPVKDTKLLIDRIEKLIANTDLRIKMGIESRKLAEKEFSIEKVLTETFAIYDC